MIENIVAHFPVMEQHLRIGCCNQPDLRLLYFRTDSIYKCVKVRLFYVMSVVAHLVIFSEYKYNSMVVIHETN